MRHPSNPDCDIALFADYHCMDRAEAQIHHEQHAMYPVKFVENAPMFWGERCDRILNWVQPQTHNDLTYAASNPTQQVVLLETREKAYVWEYASLFSIIFLFVLPIPLCLVAPQILPKLALLVVYPKLAMWWSATFWWILQGACVGFGIGRWLSSSWSFHFEQVHALSLGRHTFNV